MSKYNKFWVALGTAAGVLLLACAPDDAARQAAFVLTKTELYQVVLAFAGSLGVYQFRNGVK